MRGLAFCIALCIISILVFGLAVSGAAERVENISVVGLGGKVEAMRQGEREWIPVTLGMRLAAGDHIRTGARSYADLDFSGAAQAAVVRIGPKSSMKIDTYIASEKIENRKIKLDLAIGEILVKVNKVKDESQFQVHTPTSVVGVRGTAFEVRVSLEK